MASPLEAVVDAEPGRAATMAYRRREAGLSIPVRALAVGGWVATGVLGGVAAAANKDPSMSCETIFEGAAACLTGTLAVSSGMFQWPSRGSWPIVETILRATPAAIGSGLIGNGVRQSVIDSAHPGSNHSSATGAAVAGTVILALNGVVESVSAYRQRRPRQVEMEA